MNFPDKLKALIDQAVLDPSLKELEKILGEKENRDSICKVDNLRIRLVDHSGKRLVPAVIIGINEDSKLMAVRSFDECIVGLAATRMKAQYVPDLQTNKHFQNFLSKVTSLAENAEKVDDRKKWKDYASDLRGLKSEIAVPIIMGRMLDPSIYEDGKEEMTSGGMSDEEKKRLIGVINVNSGDRKFNKSEISSLIQFANYLSLALSCRSQKFLRDLNQSQIKMSSAFDRQDVANITAKELKQYFPGSIPNIYLFDEQKKYPFSFIVAFTLTPREETIGKFPPRWNNKEAGEGLGEGLIKRYQNDSKSDPIIVIEDVSNNPKAGSHAKESGIETVCCRLLIYNERVVGLLYLHFETDFFFLTREGLQILETFAPYAANAIHTLTVAPNFKDLYGHELLECIKTVGKNYRKQSKGDVGTGGEGQFSPQNDNERVLSLLFKLACNLENARGRAEIINSIIQGMKNIGIELQMPPSLFSIFSRFQQYEDLILFNIPNYRDHFIHIFFVFSTGFLIINEWIEKQIPFLQKTDEEISNFIKSWYIAAILHDIAYPVSNVEKWLPAFPRDTLDLSFDIQTAFDWTPTMTSGNTVEAIEDIATRFGVVIQSGATEGGKSENAFRQWFNKQLLEIHDHGALGALTILNIGWEREFVNKALDAALAVSLHNYVKTKDVPLGQLNIKDFPLAFLLTYCDVAQEWGRPTGNRSNDKDFEGILERIHFSRIKIDGNDGSNSTTLQIGYRLENLMTVTDPMNIQREGRDRIQKEISCIRERMFKNIAPYKRSWSNEGIKHDFVIEVIQQVDKNNQIRICRYGIP